MSPAALPVGIGTLVLLLLVGEIFRTVFVPRGRGGPVSRRVNRAVWSVFRLLGTIGGGGVRDGWLVLAGPAMVVSTIILWVLWLVVGFALIYYPWIESFLVSPGALRAPVTEVLYYSGYTAATLGFGDVVADSGVLRLLAPLEALGGFALLSVSVTYSLAVYRELIRKQALAVNLESFFDANDLPAPRHRRSARRDGAGRYEALESWGGAAARELSAVLLAHFQYPVLHYFRTANLSRALPVQLGRLLELRRLLRGIDEAHPAAALAEQPAYLALQESLEKYLLEVDELFTPPGTFGEEAGGENRLDRAHRRMLAYMLYPPPEQKPDA